MSTLVPDGVDYERYSNPDLARYTLSYALLKGRFSDDRFVPMLAEIARKHGGARYNQTLLQIQGKEPVRTRGRYPTSELMPPALERTDSYSAGGTYMLNGIPKVAKPRAKAIRLAERLEFRRARREAYGTRFSQSLARSIEHHAALQKRAFDSFRKEGLEGIAGFPATLERTRFRLHGNFIVLQDMGGDGFAPRSLSLGCDTTISYQSTHGECDDDVEGEQMVRCRDLQTVVDKRKGNDHRWFYMRLAKNTALTRTINAELAWLDVSRDMTGWRMHYPIVWLPKEYRAFLTIAGDDDLIEVDVRSSQIWCHVALFRSLLEENSLIDEIKIPQLRRIHSTLRRDEIEAFENEIREDIYQTLADYHGEPESRDAWKTAFISMLYDRRGAHYFRKPKSGCDFERRYHCFKWFRKHYPSLCRVVDEWKAISDSPISGLLSGAHAHSCAAAQRVESLAMIDGATDRLLRGIDCLPVHDALIVRRQDAAKTVEAIKDGYASVGIQLADYDLRQTSLRDSRAAVLKRVAEMKMNNQ